jgi:hypothetical protein
MYYALTLYPRLSPQLSESIDALRQEYSAPSFLGQ